MNQKTTTLLSALATAMIGILVVAWWVGRNPAPDLKLSVPGMDGKPATPAAGQTGAVDVVKIGETFKAYDGKPSSLPGAWPGFRGANFDNISRETVPLADSWPAAGPPVLWSVALGEGYAAPAVRNGRVYVLDYDEAKSADVLKCLSLDDGREIWRRGYRVRVKRNHGMSRTIPAVTDKYVVTIGPRCHVMCVDAVSGDLRWGLDLERDYGTKVPLWYTGQCPLVDQDVAVIAPGGNFLLMGVDCASGQTVWSTPNPEKWNMSHASVVPFVLNGKRMYVYCAAEGTVGVSAQGDDRGKVLWSTREWANSVIAPSPLSLGDGRIFFTAGYSAGSAMLKVEEDKGSYKVTVLQRLKPGEGLASEQQTPIFFEGHLFAILPKDGGEQRNEFVCYRADDCSKLVWSSGKSDRYGLGPYLLADGKFYVMDDSGVLTMLKASTRGYERLARAKVLTGVDSWGPIALVGGRMMVRDSKRMVCLDVRKN